MDCITKMPVNKVYYEETEGKHTVILASHDQGYRRTFETKELAMRCLHYLESCIGGLDPHTAMMLFAFYV